MLLQTKKADKLECDCWARVITCYKNNAKLQD